MKMRLDCIDTEEALIREREDVIKGKNQVANILLKDLTKRIQ